MVKTLNELMLSELKKTEFYNKISEFVDHQNGHINCSFRNIIIDNHIFNITLYFYDNKLIIANLFCLFESMNNEFSWSNWSLEKEQERRELHNKLLKKWLGKGEEKI